MGNAYDLLVLGAGPAGINAALSAAKLGVSVGLVDDQAAPGGQIWRPERFSTNAHADSPELRMGNNARRELANSSVVTMTDTKAWHIEQETSGHWSVHVIQEGTNGSIQAKALVIATGAREVVSPFPGWTMPGVLGLAGTTAILKESRSPPGKRTVIAGSGPLPFYLASQIILHGGDVAAVVTANSVWDWTRASRIMSARPDLLLRGLSWITKLKLAGAPILWRSAVRAVEGDTSISAVHVSRLDGNWAPIGANGSVQCDTLCVGHGLVPNIEAARLAGVPIKYEESSSSWTLDVSGDGTTPIKGIYVCGDGAGIMGAAASAIHGTIVGLRAVQQFGLEEEPEIKKLRMELSLARQFGHSMAMLSRPKQGLNDFVTANTIICRCEGVEMREILTQVETGATSIPAIKAATRAGMGPCGGKYCGGTLSRLVAGLTQRNESEFPPANERPPLRPVTISDLTGGLSYEDLPLLPPAPL